MAVGLPVVINLKHIQAEWLEVSLGKGGIHRESVFGEGSVCRMAAGIPCAKDIGLRLQVDVVGLRHLIRKSLEPEAHVGEKSNDQRVRLAGLVGLDAQVAEFQFGTNAQLPVLKDREHRAQAALLSEPRADNSVS